MNVIITGVTGMVGEGVLHECLNHPDVKEILLISRRPSAISHDKVKELILPGFLHPEPIRDKIRNFDACFFCLGVSSIGKSESNYFSMTHTLTTGFASVLAQENPNMKFCYVSGAGTDSTEKGKIMWARVKGKTENDLFKMSFKNVYSFRPGYLHPTSGLKNTHKMIYAVIFLYPLLKPIFPGIGTTLKELGLAMINIALHGYEKQIIEVKDIEILSRKKYD